MQTKIGFIGSFASILGFVLAVGRCSVESAPSKEVEPQIAPFWLHEDDPVLLFGNQMMLNLLGTNTVATPPYAKLYIKSGGIDKISQIRLGNRERFTFSNQAFYLNVFRIDNFKIKISITVID